jgi:glycogen synthase
MIAALGRNITRTNVFGSLAMVLLILLGGFALKRPDVVSCSDMHLMCLLVLLHTIEQ